MSRTPSIPSGWNTRSSLGVSPTGAPRRSPQWPATALAAEGGLRGQANRLRATFRWRAGSGRGFARTRRTGQALKQKRQQQASDDSSSSKSVCRPCHRWHAVARKRQRTSCVTTVSHPLAEWRNSWSRRYARASLIGMRSVVQVHVGPPLLGKNDPGCLWITLRGGPRSPRRPDRGTLRQVDLTD